MCSQNLRVQRNPQIQNISAVHHFTNMHLFILKFRFYHPFHFSQSVEVGTICLSFMHLCFGINLLSHIIFHTIYSYLFRPSVTLISNLKIIIQIGSLNYFRVSKRGLPSKSLRYTGLAYTIHIVAPCRCWKLSAAI